MRELKEISVQIKDISEGNQRNSKKFLFKSKIFLREIKDISVLTLTLTLTFTLTLTLITPTLTLIPTLTPVLTLSLTPTPKQP